MTQTVRVHTCADDGTATVIHIRQSACSGDCHKCSGCGAAQETLLLSARNPIGARPGDLVLIEAQTGPVLAAAAVLYMLPLVLFFLGYLAGQLLWGIGAAAACAAFALGIAVAVLYDRRVAKKKKTVYTITGFAGAGSGEF
jgi:sigma-E factor negative regulatory protein RseC